ncbi:MAG: hypothetical protein ACM4D3_18405 [Candidatus Sericytochromatia bacterium]
MTTVHDVETMRYPISRVSVEPTVAAEPRAFFAALALVILAVVVIGGAIAATTAFLVLPAP